MNGLTLATRVRDHAVILQELDTRQVTLAKAGQAVEESQTQLAILVRSVDERQTTLSTDFAGFVAMPFRRRLRWFLRGR